MGIKINGKHTEKDYGLKLLSMDLGIPQSLSERYRVPGSNEYIVAGRNDFFDSRPLKFKFDQFGNYSDWIKHIQKISADVNGKDVIVEIDNDPGEYYRGQAHVLTKKENNVVTEFAISIEADPLKFGNEISESIGKLTSKTITAKGDYETPCIIEINPTAAITKFTLQGLARNPITGDPEDIVIKNLTSGKKVIINGEDGTITEDGKNKYADTEMWEFPTLIPGSNIITCVSSSAACEVTIKYKPRYI